MNNPNKTAKALVIIVMGVSGCGKSTIAEAMAKQLNAHFKDGDELHPEANIEKMRSGIPLDDADREPWLVDIANYAKKSTLNTDICVIACSALKNSYREILNTSGNVVYVYLKGTQDLIASRMHARAGHFMPESLLISQFTALEEPSSKDKAVTVGIEETPAVIASNAVQALSKAGFVN